MRWRWSRSRTGLVALTAVSAATPLVAACVSTLSHGDPAPPPVTPDAPPPLGAGAPDEEGPATRVRLIISSPSRTDPPCSRLVAIVEDGEPLDLGSYCGTISEDAEARVGMLNLQGAAGERPGPTDLLWAFRALRDGDTLSFVRRDLEHEGGDWLEVAAARVPATGSLVTEITWPAESGPTPSD